jgi:hypothetical protein
MLYLAIPGLPIYSHQFIFFFILDTIPYISKGFLDISVKYAFFIYDSKGTD